MYCRDFFPSDVNLSEIQRRGLSPDIEDFDKRKFKKVKVKERKGKVKRESSRKVQRKGQERRKEKRGHVTALSSFPALLTTTMTQFGFGV